MYSVSCLIIISFRRIWKKINTFSFRADGKESLLFNVRFKTGSDAERIPADVHAPFRRVQDDETEDAVQVFGGVLRPSLGVQVNDDLAVTGCGRVKVKLLLELLEEFELKKIEFYKINDIKDILHGYDFFSAVSYICYLFVVSLQAT